MAETEEAVIAAMLDEPQRIGEVLGAFIEGRHFAQAPMRLLFEAMQNAHFAGDPVDPLTIAALKAKQLARLWGCEESEARERVQSLPSRRSSGDVVDHARLVKRSSGLRELQGLSGHISRLVEAGELGPEEIAGIASSAALRVATEGAGLEESYTFGDLGRAVIGDVRRAMVARATGTPLGANFGIRVIDRHTSGLLPTEVMVIGGEPGMGKSAVSWRAALNFATEQAKQPIDKRIGTLLLSLEMGRQPAGARFAQTVAGLDSRDIRAGTISQQQLEKLTDDWRRLADIPLYTNFAPRLRLSQLRAIIAEHIRQYNVGVVIIDHFREFDLDERLPNPVAEDEEKARALKHIARELNVALICLAHTRKLDGRNDPRPRLSDLRGSGQIGAVCDFVAFIFRPWLYASQKERETGEVTETDAEMIWEKNRFGVPETEKFFFNPATMWII